MSAVPGKSGSTPNTSPIVIVWCWVQVELEESMDALGILPIIHQAPFYGNAADVPDRPVIFAGLEFRVPSADVSALPPFRVGNSTSGPTAMERYNAMQALHGRVSASPAVKKCGPGDGCVVDYLSLGLSLAPTSPPVSLSLCLSLSLSLFPFFSLSPLREYGVGYTGTFKQGDPAAPASICHGIFTRIARDERERNREYGEYVLGYAGK
jgi:hypothetical protein